MVGVDRAVATATGLRVGRYTFKLTVSDQQGATDSAVLTVRVEEGEVSRCLCLFLSLCLYSSLYVVILCH